MLRCTRLGEGVDDAISCEYAGVDDVRPFGNAKSTAIVLLLDRIADVDEFAVFED